LGDTNLSVSDFQDKTISYDKVVREILALPFLAKSRLVIFKNLLSDGKKDLQEKILSFLPKIPSSTNLIVYESEVPDRRSALFKKLNQPKISQEFKPLEGRELRGWIKEKVEEEGGKIEEGAIDKIIEYVGNDLWRMSNEISKLVSYSRSEVTFSTGSRSHPTRPDSNRDSTATRSGDIPHSNISDMQPIKNTSDPLLASKLAQITSIDVESMVKPKIEGNIFGLIDALGHKKSREAIKLLHDLLASGEHELYIFTMIIYQFRNLLIVKDYLENSKIQDARYKKYSNNNFQISKDLGLNSYVVQKTVLQAKNFTFDELKGIYHKLFDYDVKIKTGKIEPQTALDILIVELCNK